MNIKPICFILFMTFLVSCRTNSNTSEEIVKNEISNSISSLIIRGSREFSSDKNDICQCYEGFDVLKSEIPSAIHHFSGDLAVSVCGSMDVEGQGILFSEFNIFDCRSGKSIVEYEAMQTCRIFVTANVISIEELKHLPTGQDWKWELVQVGEQTIAHKGLEYIVSESLPKFLDFEISDSLQISFLSGLPEGKGFGDNWEDDIGKLEVLSLTGNAKAWEILKNYEQYMGDQVDGALADQWKESVATVEWIRGW